MHMQFLVGLWVVQIIPECKEVKRFNTLYSFSLTLTHSYLVVSVAFSSDVNCSCDEVCTYSMFAVCLLLYIVPFRYTSWSVCVCGGEGGGGGNHDCINVVRM